MANDALGYYSDLGVSQSASLDEIRAVYRALAKIYHPDVNKDRAATEKFRRITAAYEILCDPNKRATYDSNGQSPPPSNTSPTQAPPHEQQISIVECSVCKKPTAQPRFLVFRHVVSLVFVTWVTPKAGVFCSSCAAKQAVKSTLISAALGWWGLPWGPIYTIGHGLKNAFGGEGNRPIDEQLMWQNAIAFGRKGKVEISGALASRLVGAKDKAIADAAKKLMAAFQADGIAIKPLKSSWRPDFSKMFFQIVALCIAPLLIGLVVFASPDHRSFGVGSSNVTSFQPSGLAVPPKDTTASAPLTTMPKVLSDADAWGTPKVAAVNQCTRMPVNGQIILQRIKLAPSGHRISIKNGSDGNAIIKVRDQFSSRTLVSFLVSKNQTASISGFPDGTYKIQFATGDAMLSDCQRFISPNASEFDGAEAFNTTYTSTQVISQELELTLYKITGGNARTSYIDATAFQDD